MRHGGSWGSEFIHLLVKTYNGAFQRKDCEISNFSCQVLDKNTKLIIHEMMGVMALKKLYMYLTTSSQDICCHSCQYTYLEAVHLMR